MCTLGCVARTETFSVVKFISSDCSCPSSPKNGERKVGGSDGHKLQEAGGLGIDLEGQVRSGW